MKNTNKRTNKWFKSTVAIAVASMVAIPSTLTFADETTDKTNYETVNLNDVNQIQAENNESTVNHTASPSLVPGDFFYFTKIIMEKIKLALTVNNVKEAELLANFASERLAEAQALFEEGKEEKALELINKAMENMKNADSIVIDDEDSKTEEETSSEVTSPNEDNSLDDKELVEDEGITEETDGMEEVKEVLSQNIIALTAAMEKVQNPKAKAALQKNIDKSYKKLAKKIEKIEQKLKKNESKLEDTTEIANEPSTSKDKDESTTIEVMEIKNEENEPVVENTIKNTKQEMRVEKINHQKVKEKQKEYKTEWKEKHNQLKQEKKQRHQEFKSQHKQEHKSKKEEK